MKVHAKSSYGHNVQIDVLDDDTLVSLIHSLSQATEIPQESLKIIHKGHALTGAQKVSELGVQDGDTLVVLRARKKPQPPPIDPTPEPDAAAIRQAIAKSKGVDEKDLEDDDEEDDDEKVPFQELLNSFLGGFFAHPSHRAAAPLLPVAAPAPVAVPEPPAEAVAQLTEMGFTEAQARRALRLNRNSIPLATDWLLEHADDPEPQEEAASENAAEGARVTPASEAGERRESGNGSAIVGAGGSVPAPALPLFQGNRQSAEQRLMEMGFSSSDVARALRATGNNYEAACALLVGEADEESPLDEDSPIVGAIFNNPVVSAGLANPRVMQAFRAMVEDPATVANYINDPEVGPLIMQVHSILQGLIPGFNP